MTPLPRLRAGLLVLLALLAPALGQSQRPMTFEDLWKVRRPGPPSVSPDGKWAVVELTTYDMEKNDSPSDLWLLSTDGKVQKQLTTAPGKSSGPRWSPDGRSIAFVSKRAGDEHAQVYVISPTGGEARRVSRMPMAPSALKWGPDGKTIFCIAWTWPDTPDDASYKKREKAERDSKVKAFVIDDALFRYWDRWLADGKRPMIFAVDVGTGKRRNVLAGTGKHLPPFEPSANDYDVSPDGKEVCFVADSLNKPGIDSNPDLFTLALDGKAKPKNITTDNVGSDTNPTYSPDGKKIAFLRSTTKHFTTDAQDLFIHTCATGKNVEHRIPLISKEDLPNFQALGNPRWLPDSQSVIATVERRGGVAIRQILPAKRHWFTFLFQPEYTDASPDVAREAGTVVFLRTSFNAPARAYARQPNGDETPIDTFNSDLHSRWKLGKVESVMFKGADDDPVQMWVIYPPNFDPKKKWPLVQLVHGGPHVGVTSAFSFRWNEQLWAAQGYVVGVVNFHGSSGFGKEFADSITGDLGTKPGIDVLKATDWFEKQPWIDKDRTACAGASYGGYMMAWLNGHTDRFKAMVCHAGVYSYHSQMASDVVYSRERALGAFPWNDLARVDKQSAQRYAKNFKTPTLVLHGEKDYRVPVTHGLEYFMTLKLKGVPARLVYFPDENHWVLKPQNSRLWHREVFSWLEKYIGKGPTVVK